MSTKTPRIYNAPNDSPSSVGHQIRTDHFQKQALIEAQQDQYFMQLADVTNMPKNTGKKIVRYHMIPLLDDENKNDQGLDASGAKYDNGNLYGSSKDVGTISGKLPLLSEMGGRVNRVGFKRKTLEGTFEKFGFFSEYTKASVDFDSQEDLMMHIHRETINGASKMTEDALQIDLLNSAGVVKYAGSALVDGDMNETSVVEDGDILSLGIDLDNNRTDKHTKIITGTRYIDTRTIPSARVMYVGSELLPTLKAICT